MLTLKRFKTLADTYGADLQRWPQEIRAEAEALQRASAEARAILTEAGQLDQAVGLASAAEDARLWLAGEQTAALARLRSTVGAGISTPVRQKPVRQPGWTRPVTPGLMVLARPGWVGAVAGGMLIAAAGLLVGTMIGIAPPSGDLLSALQAAPIHFLAG